MARIVGDGAANFLVGTTGNDYFLGRGGDDFLFSNGGRDFLNGGSGSDTADFSNLDRAGYLELERGGAWSGKDTATFYSIENAVGTRFDDKIVGDDNDNV